MRSDLGPVNVVGNQKGHVSPRACIFGVTNDEKAPANPLGMDMLVGET